MAKIIPPFLSKIYPFKSNFCELKVPKSCRMHYIDEGEGEVVVMLHGNPTWSFYYRNLIGYLKSFYRCLVPDHIGCGLSDKPQNYPYCLQQHVNNAVQWLKAINIGRFHLIVHDWGGAIGMGIAIRWPASIQSITVLNSASFLLPHIPFRIAICRSRLGSWAIRRFNIFAKAATWMASKKKLLPIIKAGYLYPYNDSRNRIAIDAFVQDIPIEETHPTYSALKYIQDNLWLLEQKPCLLAWGMRDFCFTPDFLFVWQHFFPNACTYCFKNAGHYVLEDAQKEILPIIRQFLIKNQEIRK